MTEIPGLVTNDFPAWRPGDPCYTCRSTDTIWEKDGIMIQPHCNGCGRDDYQEDSLAELTERERTLRTNPDTCLHNILSAKVTSQLEFLIKCVSCGSNRTALEARVGKNYMYDTDANVWVHTPRSSAVQNRFGIYRRQWEKYRDAEQEVGRRIIPFENWRNEGPQGEIRV